MIKRIVVSGEPELREPTKPVTKLDKKVLQVIRDLEETLKVQKDPEGVGIAAPQIGVPLKIFVIDHKGKHYVMCNPQIIKLSKKTNDPSSHPSSGQAHSSRQAQKMENTDEYVMEGCLSLPHYYGPVKRSWEVEFKYDTPTLENGDWKLETKQESFVGFFAQIVQHEVDHLNGKLFVDRLLEQKRLLYKLNKAGEWQEVDL